MTLPRQHARTAAAAQHEGSALAGPSEDAELAVLVERLGGPDHRVRPAALRELGNLADTRPRAREAVVRAVCAWLRSPWDTERGLAGDSGEPELRRAGTALLADHLRDPNHPTTWVGFDLDLAGAVLAGANLSGCWFTGGRVRLEGAWCIEGGLSLAGAHVTGGHLSLRHWTSGQGDIDFSGARFGGGVVTLAGAVLDRGTVSFAGALVDGGTVTFTDATICGARVDLTGVTVTGGLLSFTDVRLSAGEILLVDARLLGGTTAVRDAVLPAEALVTSGAQANPGALLR